MFSHWPKMSQRQPTETSRPASAFDLAPAPPHALISEDRHYSIAFNMLGVERNGIGIEVDAEKREVIVLARKKRESFMKGFFWVFGVPTDALLNAMQVRYDDGVLEIRIPRYSLTTSARSPRLMAIGA